MFVLLPELQLRQSSWHLTWSGQTFGSIRTRGIQTVAAADNIADSRVEGAMTEVPFVQNPSDNLRKRVSASRLKLTWRFPASYVMKVLEKASVFHHLLFLNPLQ